jgi:hypothetical protein
MTRAKTRDGRRPAPRISFATTGGLRRGPDPSSAGTSADATPAPPRNHNGGPAIENEVPAPHIGFVEDHVAVVEPRGDWTKIRVTHLGDTMRAADVASIDQAMAWLLTLGMPVGRATWRMVDQLPLEIVAHLALAETASGARVLPGRQAMRVAEARRFSSPRPA